MQYTQIRDFSRSPLSYFIAFAWGLCEGVFFFIVPDVYIGFTALFSVVGGVGSILFALAGSLCSIFIIYALSAGLGGAVTSWLLLIPGIHTSMVSGVLHDLQLYGAQAVISGPWSGIPFKIYSVLASHLSIPVGDYFLWSIPARLERTILVLLIGLVFGYIFRARIQAHPRVTIAMYLFMWVLIYTAYFFTVSP